MRKSLVVLLLATGATAFVANLALAQSLDGVENLSPRLMNGSMAKELRSRASRLGSSATTVDTTFVGFTPGHSTANNYWSIWSGSDKFSVPTGPYHRPPAKGAMWDFEGPYTDVHGDSLQGWWSYRNQMTGTGGLTIDDHSRPWRALAILRLLPRRLGDWVYDCVARNRYALFGRTEHCMLPPPEWRERFIDS